jgi:hypothetical protein
VQIPPNGHAREYEKPTASKETKPFGMLFSGHPMGCSGIQGRVAAVILISLPLIYRHSAVMFSQGQPNSTASRAAMHSSLLSIWRFSDDELL